MRQTRKPGETLLLGGISYTLESLEGAGSSAVVYRAVYGDSLSIGSRHQVFIKELFPLTADDSIYRGEDGSVIVKEEAKTRMDHYRERFLLGNQVNLDLLSRSPGGIAGNINSFEAYGTYYSLLSLHGGENLMTRLEEKGQFSLEEAASVLRRILLALDIFHQDGLLHLDISPDNVLLLPEQALLIDYNSVWDTGSGNWEAFAFSEKLGYTAPEVKLRNTKEIGFSTDLFSVCAVFFRMLTGRTLRDADLTGRSLLRALSPQTQSAWNAPQTAAAKAVQILLKGLHTLTRKRYLSVAELLEDLDELDRRIHRKGVTRSALWESSRAVLTERRQNTWAYLPQNIREEDGELSQQELLAQLAMGRSYLLTGSGGMGKTRYLQELWKRTAAVWNPRQPLVLYLSLRDHQQTGGEGHFILRSFLRSLRFSEQDPHYADAMHTLETLFAEETGIILLLDGLNESGTQQEKLLQEIEALSRNKGVGILVTDRSDAVLRYGLEGFVPAELLPLTDAQQEQALKTVGLTVPAAMTELLSNPMMLFLYAGTMTAGEKRPVRDAGELIRRYLEKFCLRALRTDSGDERKQLCTQFVLEHLLPEIAGAMDRGGKTVLTLEELSGLCEKSYQNLRNGAFEAAFPQYKGRSRLMLQGIANASEWYDLALRELLMERFGLIEQTESGYFRLFHDNFQPTLADMAEENRKKLQKGQKQHLRQLWKKYWPAVAALVLVCVMGGGLLWGWATQNSGDRSGVKYTTEEENEIDNAIITMTDALSKWSLIVTTQQEILEMASSDAVLNNQDETSRQELEQWIDNKLTFMQSLSIPNLSDSRYQVLQEIGEEKGLFDPALLREVCLQTKRAAGLGEAALEHLRDSLCHVNSAYYKRDRRQPLVQTYKDCLDAETAYIRESVGVLLSQMTRRERSMVDAPLREMDVFQGIADWTAVPEEYLDTLAGNVQKARGEMLTHGYSFISKSFRAVADYTAPYFLSLDEDSYRLDLALDVVGAYLDGTMTHDETWDWLMETLYYYEEVSAQIQTVAIDDTLATHLADCGILEEEYVSFLNSRGTNIGYQGNEIWMLMEYLYTAEEVRDSRDSLVFWQENLTKVQEAMDGYYYGTLNYYFADANSYELSYLEDTITKNLKSCLPEHWVWCDSREAAEEQINAALDYMEKEPVEDAQINQGEKEKELLHMQRVVGKLEKIINALFQLPAITEELQPILDRTQQCLLIYQEGYEANDVDTILAMEPELDQVIADFEALTGQKLS